MTNEQIVSEIRNGFSVTDNMQSLYEKNLPLIRTFIKPYAAYEPMEDLLQEAYFGLWEAVHHYETAENVLFMTYARFWIKQAVIRYMEKCGSVVKYSSHMRQKMTRYKKIVERLEQEQGRTPTNGEVADVLGLDLVAVLEIKSYTQEVTSLDSPLAVDDDLTLVDTLQGDSNPENDIVDKIYTEHAKTELWGIVERHTGKSENRIIKEYFINNKSLRQIAKELGISAERVRTVKENGLRRLRIGKARRELLRKFEVVDAGIYSNGFKKFNEHGFTSTVEYIAIRRAEIQAEYERRKKEIEDMLNQSKRVCL